MPKDTRTERGCQLHYQHCRWYDVYPRLAFVLRLVRLLPVHVQGLVGVRLRGYLASRRVSVALPEAYLCGNRWYDQVDTLADSLECLKAAPDGIKLQSAEYLFHLLEETGQGRICA